MSKKKVDGRTGFHSMQPCWTCTKADGGSNCPWANRLEPVPGWTAEETVRKESGRPCGVGYKILSCPLYDKEETKGGVYYE